MTTTRFEYAIEASTDRVTWRTYEFRYKPCDPRRRPPFVAPHQPRLDWQMWFAAIHLPSHQHWVQNLMARLLEGAPDVLGLLANNPFEDGPPKHIRLVRYEYRFADPMQGGITGAWWQRRLVGRSGIMTRRQANGAR